MLARCRSLSLCQGACAAVILRVPCSPENRTPPRHSLPELKPAGALPKPVTRVTTLPNGLRVATEESYGQVCVALTCAAPAGSEPTALAHAGGLCHGLRGCRQHVRVA